MCNLYKPLMICLFHWAKRGGCKALCYNRDNAVRCAAEEATMGPRPCPACGEYLEPAGEGTDAAGALYDVYICVECGHEEAVPQAEALPPPARCPWDPPDGAPQRGI